jgi:catechol 2,3-dioxygenase-like lactoylglutathione lyase family enzyme
MNEHYFVGVDLGQKQDYTAIAVVERAEVQTGFDWACWAPVMETRHSLRHLERVRLGTPYPEVVARVREVVQTQNLAGRCVLVADATGVGGPVMDLLRADGLPCELVPVTITGGDQAQHAGRTWRVPKRDLVIGLQVMLETGALRIAADLREGETFVKELTNMRVKVSASGRESFAAWREGAHDDLVLAVALACWRSRRRDIGHVGRPLGVE